MIIEIKDAILFLRSLKDKSEFEIIASNEATVVAIKYLDETKTYIEDCVIEAHRKREELSTSLQKAREASLKAFETVIEPKFQEIIKELQMVQKIPLPRTHKADAFSGIRDDMQTEFRKISDLIGLTYTR